MGEVKRKLKCHSCGKTTAIGDEICFHCGVVLKIKTGMLNKKELKKTKVI